MNAPEYSSVYLNIVELFQEGKLTDYESDCIEDLPYMAHYPQNEKTTVQEADVSDHWGPKYKARLYQLLELHKHLFWSDLRMFNNDIKMPIPFWDETNVTGLKQVPFSLSWQDQKAIDKVLDPLIW